MIIDIFMWISIVIIGFVACFGLAAFFTMVFDEQDKEERKKKMRDATPTEKEQVDRYIKSISIPVKKMSEVVVDMNFDELED